MNIASISRLPDDMPGTLGAPIRREQPKLQDQGRWVPASEPGYLWHTKTGAVSHEQFVPDSERPAKPAQMVTVGIDMASGLDQAVFVTITSDGQRINHKDDAQPAASGEAPSVDDFLRAVGAARRRGAITEEIKGLMEAKFGAPKFTLIPADRRAEVIRALGQLGS